MFYLHISGSLYRRRQWHPTPVLLPGESHGWRSLVGCSPWGLEESDTTEWHPFHFSLSCTGEENGNPLQCSCLENPRDGGAWWAAIYGVTQSRTRLKWLSSSSSLLKGQELWLIWLLRPDTLLNSCWFLHSQLLGNNHVFWNLSGDIHLTSILNCHLFFC